MNIANKYNYTKPIIKENNIDNTKSYLRVKGLRHCLIEHLQQNELYVSNDITLGYNQEEYIRTEQNIEEKLGGEESEINEESINIDGILLYGTNAVGKTSLIKSIGILIIMAQAGLFVPASSLIYYPYKSIYTRILNNDNIFKGLSTFAVEMSELRTILINADKNSLVLGDELCSGTESISAKSIFVSGLHTLTNKQSCFIFATHLHEILDYTEVSSLHRLQISHMSVLYDTEKMMLIYNRKIQKGPGNHIYGLEVCKSLYLPENFINYANDLIIKYNPKYGNILDAKVSTYNSKHLKHKCDKCKINYADEVHHLQYQQNSNENGIIKNINNIFHKNHNANLLSLCNECHDMIHKQNIEYIKVKTTKGYLLQELIK